MKKAVEPFQPPRTSGSRGLVSASVKPEVQQELADAMGVLPPASDPVARMFRQVLTGWAQDTLAAAGSPWWRGLDPLADYQDRDWKKLYGGSVLDD